MIYTGDLQSFMDSIRGRMQDYILSSHILKPMFALHAHPLLTCLYPFTSVSLMLLRSNFVKLHRYQEDCLRITFNTEK